MIPQFQMLIAVCIMLLGGAYLIATNPLLLLLDAAFVGAAYVAITCPVQRAFKNMKSDRERSSR